MRDHIEPYEDHFVEKTKAYYFYEYLNLHSSDPRYHIFVFMKYLCLNTIEPLILTIFSAALQTLKR